MRDVTVELYEQWLAARPPRTEEERRAAAEAWLEGWEQMWRELEAMPKADPRNLVQIVLDERR